MIDLDFCTPLIRTGIKLTFFINEIKETLFRITNPVGINIIFPKKINKKHKHKEMKRKLALIAILFIVHWLFRNIQIVQCTQAKGKQEAPFVLFEIQSTR